MNQTHTGLCALEISYLWAGYAVDSMSVSILSGYSHHATNNQVKDLLTTTAEFGQEQVNRRSRIMSGEGMPLPKGFIVEEEVHMSAPRLFSDRFYLIYLSIATRLGLLFYSQALGVACREDVRFFSSDSLQATERLQNSVLTLMQNRGEYFRPPVLTAPDHPEFIQKTSFLNGFFGDKRPLTGMEISGLYSSMELVLLMEAISTGFAQVSSDAKVREQFLRMKELTASHKQSMEKVLEKDDLPAPVSFVAEVTNSTKALFSERLMLCHAAGLNGTLIEAYGNALSYTMRNDVAALYLKQIAQVGMLAESMTKTLVDFEWLEKPPGALER
ncbi:DUF3231 family protein [Paenibacillus mesotrionivorans]|uniref:DUF3231 family protein n=1 Tax=Paenibacillus mesotrionivorans TaxID=3160968 RepID=A0ACC7NS78_9BACL